jgi:hypothetical protein
MPGRSTASSPTILPTTCSPRQRRHAILLGRGCGSPHRWREHRGGRVAAQRARARRPRLEPRSRAGAFHARHLPSRRERGRPGPAAQHPGRTRRGVGAPRAAGAGRARPRPHRGLATTSRRTACCPMGYLDSSGSTPSGADARGSRASRRSLLPGRAVRDLHGSPSGKSSRGHNVLRGRSGGSACARECSGGRGAGQPSATGTPASASWSRCSKRVAARGYAPRAAALARRRFGRARPS